MTKLPDGVREAVPLSRHTTMRVGGPARFLANAGDGAALVELICWADAEVLPWVVLGEGSNVLFADEGYDGLVIVFVRPSSLGLPSRPERTGVGGRAPRNCWRRRGGKCRRFRWLHGRYVSECDAW